MMKKLSLILSACALGLSLFAFAACNGEPEYNTNYGEENGGDPASVSDIFSPDGVLNEEVYDNVRWLRNYAIDPAAFSNDIDRAKTLADAAAQLNMTAFFRDGGMYVAIDVQNEKGEAAYVNSKRDELLNSGVELVFRNYKVKLSPAGSYVWEEKKDGAWVAYSEGTPCVLGVQAKTAPINDADNTGYVLEFFVPAENLNAMGYDAAALAHGVETLPADVVLVTSYGSDETAAARWEMSALLAWDDYYEFGQNGAETFDVTVETTGEKGASQIAESALRDYAVPYNDVTFLVKAAEGYRLKNFAVNGVEYDVEYIQGGVEKGYVTLLTDDVNTDLHVTAEFEKNLPVAFAADAETLRFGKETALDGVCVTFEEAGQRYTFDVADGRLEGQLPYGVYRVSVSDGLYDEQTITFGPEGLDRIRFTYRAFSSDKFGDAYGGYHDYSRVNREDGVIENIDGNSFLPVTNEAFGDSAFTVTFRYSQMTKDSRLGIRYIWDEKTNDKQMRNAVIAEMNMQSGELMAGWADYTDNWNNYNVTYEAAQKTALPDSFAAAFTNGNGVSLMLVRTGNVFTLYAEIAGNEASRLYVTEFTLENDTIASMDGHWAVYIWDTANGIEVPVMLEENADGWKNLKYAVTDETGEGAHGSVAFNDGVTVGDPVTFTFAPDTNYTLLSFTINGDEYIGQVKNNTLTLTENVPLTMTVTAIFGIENYTVNVDLSAAGGRVNQDDLIIAFEGAAGQTVYARHDSENTWKASLLAGSYSYTVYAFGGFAVAEGAAEVTDGGTLTVAVTETTFDIVIADQTQGGSAEICGPLGSPSSFVYSGFMGIDGAEIEDTSRFAAETQFCFEDGTTMQVQFVRWDNTYEFKFMINDQNNGVSFMLTSAYAPQVFERVLQDDGVWFTLVVEDGVASVWAKNTADEWVQLETWDHDSSWDGIPDNSPIVRVEFRKRYDGTAGTSAVLKDGKLQLGTAEAAIGSGA